MPIALKREAIARLFPRASEPIREALYVSQGTHLARFGITKSARSLAYFLAQCAEESGGLTVFSENLNYSVASIRRVWPSHPEWIQFAGKPDKLANAAYGGRMGNTAPGDGWKYRGRGPIQLTGKANYKAVGDLIGVDLITDPDRALDSNLMLLVTAGYWQKNNLNRFADEGDFIGLTRAVNGGTTNLAERQRWVSKISAELANRSSVEDAPSTPQPRPQAPVPPPPDVEPIPPAPLPQGGLITRLLRLLAGLLGRLLGGK